MKIVRDVPGVGLMPLCFNKQKGRYMWSRHRVPLDVSIANAVALAKLLKLAFVEVVGDGLEVVKVVTLNELNRGVVDSFVRVADALHFADNELSAIGGCEDFAGLGDAGVHGDAPSVGEKPRDSGRPVQGYTLDDLAKAASTGYVAKYLAKGGVL